jgi:glycosyl transferase family 87
MIPHEHGNRLKRLVISLAAVLLIIQITVVAMNFSRALDGQADFLRSYDAGKLIRSGDGHSLYAVEGNPVSSDERGNTQVTVSPFERFAYEALLYVPLSYFSYRNAFLIFMALNLALIALSVRMLQPYLPKLEQLWRWLPTAVFICFLPVGLALIAGHDSILLLALMLASAVSFYREHDFGAGVFLGMTLFRPEFAVLIALLFLFWRRWRIVAGFLAASAVSLAISTALTGLAGFESYLRNSLTWTTQLAPMTTPLNGMVHSTVMPNLWCLIAVFCHQFLSPDLLHAVTAVVAVGLVVWAATRPPNFALAILIALLVAYHSSIYDTVLLILPVAMVMDSRIQAASGNQLLARNIVGVLFVAPTLFFLLGWNYCLLALLILALLIPLRSTSSGPAPPQLLGSFWAQRQP